MGEVHRRAVTFGGLWCAAALAALPAWASPSMVRHNYGSCATCHVDPSGAGQLTPYGRAQAELLLRWRPTAAASDAEELPSHANFLWFLELPDELNLSGNLRGGALVMPSSPLTIAPLVMATDVYATVRVRRFVGHATAGVGLRRTEKAALFPRCDPQARLAAGRDPSCGVQAIAREFWLGATFADEAVTVRGGRMNLPFGLRNVEHTSWVRDLTNTDVSLDQQVGLSAAYTSDRWRGEAMAILGNFQLGPDPYRERGYSLFAEYSLSSTAYLGLSSLLAYAAAELGTGQPLTRQAHGLFARYSPASSVALLAEGNLLAANGTSRQLGFAALAQGDVEVLRGLHLAATLEGMHRGDGAQGPSWGAWGTVIWYPLPHLELRVDAVYRRERAQAQTVGGLTFLLQMHVFL